MIKATVRRSRKARYCDSCDRYTIKAGDLYRSLVASPNDNDVNSCNPHWWRIAECALCAERYGHSMEVTK